MPQPWEQRAGEPTDSYAKFIFFRNLGPGRTLQLAYNGFRKTFKNADPAAIDSKKQQPVPGGWGADSAQFEWHERADLYDIHIFNRYGERAMVKFIGALDKIAEKACEALAKPSMRPKTWNDLLNALTIIQSYAIPGSVNEARTRAANPTSEPGPDAGTSLSCLIGSDSHGTVSVGELLAGGNRDDGVT